VALAEEGIALYENLRTPPVFWPQLLSLKAQVYAMAGRTAEALDAVDQAAGLASEGSWDSAGLKIQRADLLLSMGDAQGAESFLRRALDEAQQAGGRMLQLRAATRLARLMGRVSPAEGTAMLQEIVETFIEGADNPDVLEARAVLDEAATRGP
jgi:predicted Zn-dependent protease